MPSDLGRSEKIRNNCRPERDISEYGSKTTRVEALSSVPAADQDWKIN